MQAAAITNATASFVYEGQWRFQPFYVWYLRRSQVRRRFAVSFGSLENGGCTQSSRTGCVRDCDPGQCRLRASKTKILDLSEKSQQPMIDADLGLTLVFNGCIYNFRELRTELEQKGYKFFSDGDTEVILKAWHAWGESCVSRFLGMFAFAIHERDTGRIILARDRFGIKPLYLAEVDGALRFASSLPALVKAGGIDTSIDRAALHNYMSFHAVVPPPLRFTTVFESFLPRRCGFTNRMAVSATVSTGGHLIAVCPVMAP